MYRLHYSGGNEVIREKIILTVVITPFDYSTYGLLRLMILQTKKKKCMLYIFKHEYTLGRQKDTQTQKQIIMSIIYSNNYNYYIPS
jgi:hypothetical protein